MKNCKIKINGIFFEGELFLSTHMFRFFFLFYCTNSPTITSHHCTPTGHSRLRGVLLYELQTAILRKAQLDVEKGTLTPHEWRALAQVSQAHQLPDGDQVCDKNLQLALAFSLFSRRFAQFTQTLFGNSV